MITGLVEGFILFCIRCRKADSTNIHFKKPKEIVLQCLNCGSEQNLIYDFKNAKEPTTKIERVRMSKLLSLKIN